MTMRKNQTIFNGDTFKSEKYGTYRVVDYVKNNRVLIRFDATGHEAYYSNSHGIRNGLIRDPLHPNVHGVGFVGVGPHLANNSTCHARWAGMFLRCYSVKWHEKYPTYIGCTVATEWHNFQVFAKWFYENYIEGYDLDKDSIITGNKVYGPTTCKFITPFENKSISREPLRKTYHVLDPEGNTHRVRHQKDFTHEHGLSYKGFNNMLVGKTKSSGGWKLKPQSALDAYDAEQLNKE